MATVDELLSQLEEHEGAVQVAKAALDAALKAKVATQVALGQAYQAEKEE